MLTSLVLLLRMLQNSSSPATVFSVTTESSFGLTDMNLFKELSIAVLPVNIYI